MSVKARLAVPSDLSMMVELLLEDAELRRLHDPALWPIADDARDNIADAVTFALTAEKQSFKQGWFVADTGDSLVGILHSMLLPVPPIYAGNLGAPGLLLPESFVTQDAPAGTLEALIDIAEADLRAAGAKLLLASFVCEDEWRQVYQGRGYEPLTLYLSRSGMGSLTESAGVRPATEADIEGIVARSAEHRTILHELDAFWTPHAEADTRFESWMRKSLSFPDRDMLVHGSPDALEGYVIAQPASRLHFPPAHDISATGVIDDFFHRQFANPGATAGDTSTATALLQAAESSFAARGIETAFVVCPATWTSKVAVLENAGYETAMVWMMKR